MLLERLREFVEGAQGDTFAACDVIDARKLLDELELTWLESLGQADVEGVGVESGCRSTGSWLALHTTSRVTEGHRDVALARKLRLMPAVVEAMREGVVSFSQARILTRAVNPRTIEIIADHEEILVANAAGLNAAQTEFLVSYWLRGADPDGTKRKDESGEEARRLALRETLPGEWWLDGHCTAQQAEILNTAVEALVSMWLRDNDDDRTISQMRMDALVEVCRQWLTFGDTPAVRDERPHVNINVDLDTLLSGTGVATFDSGNPVPADNLSEFLCDCVITRILSSGSLVLDVGRKNRLVTPAQRKAVKKRDGCCRYPGCSRPPSQCDVHHIIEWLNGGKTDLNNMVLLCRYHHGWIHRAKLDAILLPDLTFRVRDRDGHEMESKPPPTVAQTSGRHTTKHAQPNPVTELCEIEQRKRVRESVERFKQSVTLTDQDVRDTQLIRQRLQTLVRQRHQETEFSARW